MKLILPSLFILLCNYLDMKLMMILMSMLMLLTLISISQENSMIMMNSWLMMDSISSIMVILSLTSVMLILLSSSLDNTVKLTMPPIMLILLLTFMSSNMLSFYILFEMVLIPTLILITKSGKQPERLQAGIYLFMYTIMGSLPLLMGILYWMNYSSILLSYTICFKLKFFMLFMMAFCIKMPMFFFHLWLPKAHVEAPVEGSMILAAILLKLGGYGLIRFFPMIFHKLNNISSMLMSISLMGASATSLNCIRQKDLKALIAYSSVSHMALVLSSLMTLTSMGLKGAMIMMISHALSSSALFLLVNIIYEKYHTRNTMMFKGLMSIFPNITFWWFMFTALNISAPPSISTLSEIFILMSLIQWNMTLMLILMLSSITLTTFSILLFINISHNTSMKIYPSENIKHKMFLTLFMHMTPLILMISKMEIMSL